MNSELVFKDKGLLDDGYTTRTIYANDVYNVFILQNDDEEDGLEVNIFSEDFHAPNITLKYGVNIPASGSLKLKELNEHIEKVILAKETFEQVIKIVDNLK